MPSFRVFDALMRPKLRQPFAHAIENSAPISGNPATKELIGRSEGKTIKVRARTLRGLGVAEGIIHDVKKECVPAAGNQITDLHRTDGWSYLLAQTYRHREKSESTLRTGPKSDLARAAIQLQAGTCRTYAVCSYVLAQAKCRDLPANDPLRARPLHLVSDSERDHTYVVWGKRAKGHAGKFEDEAIVIDAWPGLPKPFLAKELGKEKKKLDALASIEWTAAPGNGASFDLQRETAAARTPEAIEATKEKIARFLEQRAGQDTAPENLQEIKKHLQGSADIPTSGPSLLEWVLKDHETKDFLDDRITFVDDVSTRYVDKDGKHGTFDQLNAQYVQEFVQQHEAARAGKLGAAADQRASSSSAGRPEGD